jgi:hypothetical protein
MIPIVTDYGDFDVEITAKELECWNEKFSIEGDLLKEGEIPCGKKIKIIFKPDAQPLVDYQLEGTLDWDEAKIVKLICNQKAHNKLKEDGGLYTELTYIRVKIAISFATMIG